MHICNVWAESSDDRHGPEGQPPGLTDVIQAARDLPIAIVIAILVASILGAIVVGWLIVRPVKPTGRRRPEVPRSRA